MIVIPMAGLSSRFLKAGYTTPKYMLEAHGQSVFEHAVKSFEHYFNSEHFVFIVRDIADTPSFVKDKALSMGIKSFEVITLESETRGQAETVFEGLSNIDDSQSPITIFNIDTFRPGFFFPRNIETKNYSYLEVFQGTGDNWSFVLPKEPGSTEVIKTAEKNPISNLCCTGLYHFSSIACYLDAYSHFLKNESIWEKGELYVAPLYNYLIENGHKVHYHIIPKEDVIFCGIPSEYEEFKSHGYNT